MKTCDKPTITYPTSWEYTLIGEDRAELENLVLSNVKSPKIKDSNKSKNGKFVSIKVEVLVQTQQERDSIFAIFSKSPIVKMVL